jgi:hypothetical protein
MFGLTPAFARNASNANNALRMATGLPTSALRSLANATKRSAQSSKERFACPVWNKSNVTRSSSGGTD